MCFIVNLFTSLIFPLLSRNFCQECVREIKLETRHYQTFLCEIIAFSEFSDVLQEPNQLKKFNGTSANVNQNFLKKKSNSMLNKGSPEEAQSLVNLI